MAKRPNSKIFITFFVLGNQVQLIFFITQLTKFKLERRRWEVCKFSEGVHERNSRKCLKFEHFQPIIYFQPTIQPNSVSFFISSSTAQKFIKSYLVWDRTPENNTFSRYDRKGKLDRAQEKCYKVTKSNINDRNAFMILINSFEVQYISSQCSTYRATRWLICIAKICEKAHIEEWNFK